MPEILFQAFTNLNYCAINRCQFNMIQKLDWDFFQISLIIRRYCRIIHRNNQPKP